MTWTKEAVDRLTSAQYAAHMSDPEFCKFVDETGSQPVARKALATGNSTARDRAQLAVRSDEDPAFDPSFDNDGAPATAVAVEESTTFSPAVPVVPEPVAPVAVVPPVIPVPEVPAELPEKLYEYTITDDNGKPIGGKQVFKYRTTEELVEKLRDSNIHVRRMAQKLKEDKILNGTDVPENATPAAVLGLRPTLGEAERKVWEEKLQDPATAAQAQYQLDRDDDHAAHNSLVQSNYQNSVLLALETFKNRNRDYIASNDNAVKLIGFIERRGLDPTDARNYQRAYDTLRESDLLSTPAPNQSIPPVLVEEAPKVREEKTVPNPQVPVEATARISPEVPPQETRPVTPAVVPAVTPVAPPPTGLSNADIQTDGEPSEESIENQLVYRRILKDGAGKPTGVVETYKGIEALKNMPSPEYKKLLEADLLKERQTGVGTGFRKTCDDLEALEEKRRQRARLRR